MSGPAEAATVPPVPHHQIRVFTYQSRPPSSLHLRVSSLLVSRLLHVTSDVLSCRVWLLFLASQISSPPVPHSFSNASTVLRKLPCPSPISGNSPLRFYSNIPFLRLVLPIILPQTLNS